jgi:hypothetical protein
MCRLCCLGGGLAVVRRRGGLRQTASVSRIGTANRRLHVLDRSVLMVVGDEAEEEEVEVEEDLGTRTGATAQGATRQVAARLGDAEARAMIVGARAGALHPEGESAITVLREVVEVDGGAARATPMLVTGATAVIAAVAVVGTVVDAGGSTTSKYKGRESLQTGSKMSSW